MAPPIKYGLGYRSQTLTLKVKIMYAVQNDTEIKFSIVLYVKVIFVGQGVGIQKRPIPQSANYHLRYDD